MDMAIFLPYCYFYRALLFHALIFTSHTGLRLHPHHSLAPLRHKKVPRSPFLPFFHSLTSSSQPVAKSSNREGTGKELWLYNTMSRRKELFKPKVDRRVGMYVCGVTAYDLSHIGHARVYVTFDVLYRYLNYLEYEVSYVRNFTDVDDKIITRANDLGEDPINLSRRYCEEFQVDISQLCCLLPSVEPRVSEHLPHIIDMIKQSAKKGEPSWESPWGTGRPGWHIECSAMSAAYLGYSSDIHGGGMDLVFPHHVNDVVNDKLHDELPHMEVVQHASNLIPVSLVCILLDKFDYMPDHVEWSKWFWDSGLRARSRQLEFTLNDEWAYSVKFSDLLFDWLVMFFSFDIVPSTTVLSNNSYVLPSCLLYFDDVWRFNDCKGVFQVANMPYMVTLLKSFGSKSLVEKPYGIVHDNVSRLPIELVSLPVLFKPVEFD